MWFSNMNVCFPCGCMHSLMCVHDPDEKQDGVLWDLVQVQGFSDLLDRKWLYLTESDTPRSSHLDSDHGLVSDMIAVVF